MLKPNEMAESLLRKALGQLQQGTLDSDLLAPNLKFFFTDQVIADYQASLAGLGKLQSLELLSENERGGMTGLYYAVHGTGPRHHCLCVCHQGKDARSAAAEKDGVN